MRPMTYLQPENNRFPVWNDDHARWCGKVQRWATNAVKNCKKMGAIDGALMAAGAIDACWNPQLRMTCVVGKHSCASLRFRWRSGRIVCDLAWVEMQAPDCP